MQPTTALDIQGFEYDWLAADEDGRVALFSTAEGGYAPLEFLRNTDAHAAAIEVLLATAATTPAELAPELGPGFVNTWRLVAERGLFAYDSDLYGGPYRLVAVPVHAARVEALPLEVAEVATTIVCRFRFDEHRVVTRNMLEAGRTVR